MRYNSYAAVTPSDVNNTRFDALYVGGAGNITVINSSGHSVAFVALPVGTILPVSGTRVMATGTTATNLVAMLV